MDGCSAPDCSTRVVRARTRAAGAAAFGPVQTVHSGSASLRNLQAATDSEGTVAIAWQEGAANDVVAAVRRAGAGAAEPVNPTTTTTQNEDEDTEQIAAPRLRFALSAASRLTRTGVLQLRVRNTGNRRLRGRVVLERRSARISAHLSTPASHLRALRAMRGGVAHPWGQGAGEPVGLRGDDALQHCQADAFGLLRLVGLSRSHVRRLRSCGDVLSSYCIDRVHPVPADAVVKPSPRQTEAPMNGARLRIGELSRRLGVSPELLRAWERRYGIPRPSRSEGGLRLYSREDEQRLRKMRAHIAAGVSPAEAAALVMRTPPARDAANETLRLTELTEELERSLDRFDDAAAQSTLDRLFAEFTIEASVEDVVLPYLRRLGERWERAEATVAQEHFASNLLRARLLAVGRGWDAGAGPRAILACPAGELHDLGLVCFGLVLRSRGWRITFLGQDTPAATLLDAADRLAPDAVVLAAMTAEHLTAMKPTLDQLASSTRLLLGGRAARLCNRLPGEALQADPVAAAKMVAATPQAGVNRPRRTTETG